MSTLGVAIGTADTVIVVPGGLTVGSFPAPFTIDSEYILVSGGGSGLQFYSVERGQNGSARATHALGAAITAGWSAAAPVALTSLTGSLATDFALSVDEAYHTVTGCSVALTAGTWLVEAMVGFSEVGGATDMFARLYDGTTAYAVVADDAEDLFAHSGTVNASLPAIVVAAGPLTLALQARTTDHTNGDSILSTLDSQPAGAATHIVAVKIA